MFVQKTKPPGKKAANIFAAAGAKPKGLAKPGKSEAAEEIEARLDDQEEEQQERGPCGCW